MSSLEAAVSAARTVIAYDGGLINYYIPSNHVLAQWGITSIDGVPVVIDESIPRPVTGR